MTAQIVAALATAGIPADPMLAILDELGLSCAGFGHLTVDIDWPYASLTVLAPASDEARRAFRDRLHARDVPASVIVSALDRPSRAWLVEIGSARAAGDVPIKLHARGERDALADIAHFERGNDPLLEGAATTLLGGRIDAVEIDDHGIVFERASTAADDAHLLLAIARRIDVEVENAAFLAAHARIAGDRAIAVIAGRDGVSGVRCRYAPAGWADLIAGLALLRGAVWRDTGPAITSRIAAIASALDATHPAGLSVSFSRHGIGARAIIDVATPYLDS